VTLVEAATHLGVAPATLRHQIRNGSLEATKVGRDWTVDEAEVQRYTEVSLGKPGRPPRGQPRRREPTGQLSLDLLDDMTDELS
jgi:excisionase family DNA binding protein